MPKSRREVLIHIGLAGAASALGAMPSSAADPAPSRPAKPDAGRVGGMPMPLDGTRIPDPELVRRIKAISNVFEVGDVEPDYGYVENLGDGRGYTVTQYGFCTYNSEVTQVIERYLAHAPKTPLKRFLPELPPIKWTEQKLDGFAHVWRREIQASKFLGEACDEEANVLFFSPAIHSATAVGVKSPIGMAIFYDTLLQHGAGTDADSLPSILKRALEENGSVAATSEPEFLKAFLDVRKSVLENSTNHETRHVWRASARRVDALGKLLKDNPNLVPPIEVANADIEATVL